MAPSSDRLDMIREAIEDGRGVILVGDVPSDDLDITEDILEILDDLSQ